MEGNGIYNLGTDFDWGFLKNRRESFHWAISGDTAASYDCFAVMPLGGVIEEFWVSHSGAGTAGGTVQLEKLTAGQAAGAGTVMTAAYALNTAANTPAKALLSPDIASRQFARGDRLALRDAGTLTGTGTLTVTAVVRYKNR